MALFRISKSPVLKLLMPSSDTGTNPGLWNRIWKCTISTQNEARNEPTIDGRNKPIKFSSSQAKVWRSLDTFTAPQHMRQAPWYQQWIVLGSIAVFLVYFTMLRDENDIDEILSGDLEASIPGIEERTIRIAMEYEQQHGRSTEKYERRLAEIAKAKKKD